MRRPSPAYLLLIAAALAGCPGGKAPTTPAASGPKGTPRPAASPARPARAVPVAGLAAAMAGRTPRAVQGGVATTLRGEVRLLSDQGAALVSNNGGGIVSDHGGGIVSDHGGGVVAGGGGRWRLAQAGPLAEARLVEAVVTVHDARGQVLTGPDGRPLAAVTDGQGRYELAAALPDENVVLRVRLWNGGELAAMRPRGGSGEQPIDTATSLGAAYVLGEYVAPHPDPQATYDRLPAGEAEALRVAIEAGRGALAGTPDYKPPVLLALAAELREKVPAVDRKLTEIKALLLGQARLGDGRPALEVALPEPAALRVLASGELLIAERALGRVRAVGVDGRVTTFADAYRGTRAKRNFVGVRGMAEGADGSLYVGAGHHLDRILPDGTVQRLAGNGRNGRATLGGPAREAPLTPERVTVGPDGTVYFVDAGGGGDSRNPRRVVAIGADGLAIDVSPPADLAGYLFNGVATGPDGTLYVSSPSLTAARVLARRPGGSWALHAELARGTDPGLFGDLVAAPDGTLYVTCEALRQVVRLPVGGPPTVVAGPGAPGEAASLDAVGSLAIAADGTLYVADIGRSRIYALAPDGGWRPFAGAADFVSRSGDLTAIALNRPFGVAPAPGGGFYFTENGGYAVKRFDGDAVALVAGLGRGYAGEGGPAAQARLAGPLGIGVRDGAAWVVDGGNDLLRRIGADGLIQRVSGRPPDSAGPKTRNILAPGPAVAGDDVKFRQCQYVAIGPDGQAYVSLPEIGQIWRVAPDGRVALVAGIGEASKAATLGGALAAPPDSAPALTTPLFGPSGLAFAPDGDLYVAETVAWRVRRISDPGGASPVLHAYAGMPLLDLIPRVASGDKLDLLAELQRPRREVPLATPAGLCFDARGDLYLTVVGTRHAGAADSLPVDAATLPIVDAGVLRFGTDGRTTLVAGPRSSLLGDVAADDALVLPAGIAIDARGRLAIADAGANLLHIIPPGMLPP